MKLQNYFQRITTILVLGTMILFHCGCSSDSSPSQAANPDAIVEYDPTSGGFFEGEATEFPNDIEQDSYLNTNFSDAATNSLSDAELNQAPAFDMEKFVEAYDHVLTEFPNIDKSSDEFARKIINKIVLNRSSSSFVRSADDRAVTELIEKIYKRYQNLTPEEINLILRNPYKAYQSYLAAESAEAMTVSLFGQNGRYDRSDAFRHSYWNWLMSKSCSVEWARIFTNAHESMTPNNDDRRMDLNNNMIGRRVFSSNPSAGEGDAQNTLLDYKLLWISEQQMNVVVGIDYLVYLRPIQSMQVYDSGPDYDDIYQISLNGTILGTTPQGGKKTFYLSQLASDSYDLDINCQVDGTSGGCGFSVVLEGALRFNSGASEASQLVIQQGGTHNASVVFPTLRERRID